MISAVASHCHIVTKEKGDTIWAPGATEDSTTILLDGVVKTFILSPDGTENTLTFWFKPGTFICPTKEMINIPEIWCVALTQCTLIEMVGTSPYKMAEDIPVLWKEIVLVPGYIPSHCEHHPAERNCSVPRHQAAVAVPHSGRADKRRVYPPRKINN